jgi:hypothetical protein
LLIAWLVAGCSGGSGASTRRCEAQCTATFVDELSACIEERAECYRPCRSAGSDCTDSCDEAFWECRTPLSDAERVCLEICPCGREEARCRGECPTGDIDAYESCVADCGIAYQDCTDEYIPRRNDCSDECVMEIRTPCLSSCDDTYSSAWDDWVDCQFECEQAHYACYLACTDRI